MGTAIDRVSSCDYVVGGRRFHDPVPKVSKEAV